MIKTKRKKAPVTVISVIVPPEFSAQVTAYKLGFHHGQSNLPARAAASFIYKPTATAYAAGYLAGSVSRASNNKTL